MAERDDQDVMGQFADAIREIGADRMAAAAGWVAAFRAACDVAEPFLPNEAAEAVVRGIFVAMREHGVDAMWPLRFGEMPLARGEQP